jgi:soluble lytic murein transglycosylase
LRDLRDRSDWHLPALLAAYNAGSAKTTEWVASFGDLDLFIERIGWRETRDYVRAVLDACWIYRAAGAESGGGR